MVVKAAAEAVIANLATPLQKLSAVSICLCEEIEDLEGIEVPATVSGPERAPCLATRAVQL